MTQCGSLPLKNCLQFDNGVSYQASKAFFIRLERLDFPSGPELKSEINLHAYEKTSYWSLITIC